MTKVNCTNSTLYNYFNQIQQMRGTIDEIFFASKIKEFTNNNGFRHETLKQSLNELYEKYLDLDADKKPKKNDTGELIYKEMSSEVQAQSTEVPVLLSQDEIKKLYTDEINSLMQKEIVIIV